MGLRGRRLTDLPRRDSPAAAGQCQYLFLLIADSNSRRVVSFQPHPFLRRPLQDQTHRELVDGPLQFLERRQHFIGANDEPLSVTMSVHNPDCSSFNIQS